MKIFVKNQIFFCIVMQISIICSGQEKSMSTKASLATQGFSGILQGKVQLIPLGAINCNSKKIKVIYYSWLESASPGIAVHASYRILFMENKRYLGSYSIEDKPTAVLSDRIVFSYPSDSGNEIVCGVNGLQPTILLNGENHSLAK